MTRQSNRSRFPGSLIDISYALPEQILTNSQLAAEFPEWHVAQTERRIGVYERRISRFDETAYDLALQATRQLLDIHPELADKVDAIIFCTQSPDLPMPSNAFLLQRDLKLRSNVLAFDYNLACSGFVYGLLMASSFIATGAAKNILVVTANTYSKNIAPNDRANRMLFGEGAAVSWIGASDQTIPEPLVGQLFDFLCASDGTGWDRFYIKSGAAREPVSQSYLPNYNDKIQMDGLQVLNFVGGRVVEQIKSRLLRNQLKPAQGDQFFLHQASRLALDAIFHKLAIGSDQVPSNIARIGNTVSASLPILIQDDFTVKSIEPDSSLLICGYGLGYS